MLEISTQPMKMLTIIPLCCDNNAGTQFHFFICVCCINYCCVFWYKTVVYCYLCDMRYCQLYIPFYVSLQYYSITFAHVKRSKCSHYVVDMLVKACRSINVNVSMLTAVYMLWDIANYTYLSMFLYSIKALHSLILNEANAHIMS